MKKRISVMAAILLLAACKPDAGTQAEWAGRWNGPEGTFLELTPNGDVVSVTITNLDGPRTFEGRYEGENVLFTRDDVRETIRPGTGKETGMKWLMEKERCLIVKDGEGYCRD